MRQVVTAGTAQAAFMTSKYKAAGKTGTAEVPDGKDNVLFVGFAPYDEPEIVIAVIIEHGAQSVYAANVARAVFDAYMDIKEGKNTNNSSEDDEEIENTDLPEAILPDRDSGDTDKKENKESEGRRPQNSVDENSTSSEGEGTL